MAKQHTKKEVVVETSEKPTTKKVKTYSAYNKAEKAEFAQKLINWAKKTLSPTKRADKEVLVGNVVALLDSNKAIRNHAIKMVK